MPKFSFTGMPMLKILEPGQIEQIHETALSVLESCGVFFDSDEAIRILAEAGCGVDKEKKIAKFPRDLVIRCIELAPETFKLYSREGEFYTEVGGNTPNFYPGSCPANILESDGVTVRNSTIADMELIARTAEFLPQMDFVSTSVVCSEVPYELGDQYIYYTTIKNTTKPIIGGAVDIPGVWRTFELLKAIRGSEQEARKKPYTVFDICPAPPLKWSDISSANIIDCAHYEIPIDFIALPMPGAGSPATLAGSLVQHTVETLSGLVLAQVIRPGLPCAYGGAPVLFDMRTTYTPMAALEANMISCGYALMGKYYGLPTHTYAVLSDAKVVDDQAGFESAMSGLLVAQSGINIISGAGGLDVIGQQSLEKLVIDAEIIGLIKRFLRGIDVTDESLARELICQVGPGGDFLQTKHTRRWFKQEQYMPSPVLDRMDRASWESKGRVGILDRAKERLEMIRQQPVKSLDDARQNALDQALLDVAKDAGVEAKIEELMR